MIVFDLVCADGHVFEAWFGSSDAYEDQRGRGLISCPVCGGGNVAEAVMAPAVAAKGNRRDGAVARPTTPPGPAEMKAMLAKLARAQAKALEQSEHVGARFAEEARAMHVGEVAERPIHGQATLAEAKALVDEGVPVAPLPLPLPPPGGTAH